MDIDIDKPSALVAIVVGLAASVLIDVSTGSRPVEAQEVTSLQASAAPSGPTTRAGCPITEAPASTRPLTAPGRVPPGPPDLRANSAGTGGAGAAGTVVKSAQGDPCERPNRLSERLRGATAASAASSDTAQ
jgi:hypothetical protein